MDYKIQDIENAFVGEITENLGNNEYIIQINGKDNQIKILTMDTKGIEFLLNQKYHKAKYLENSTNEINLVIDNVPVIINQHTNFDEIVFKNSGGAGPGAGKLALNSQIPGKVVSIAVQEGDSVNQGDVVCTLESMKMQVAVKAHKAGTIKSIKIKDGASVAKGDVIAEIE
ncbi:MAG: acetyl-CoA carboxylase biotin carboxyl carrier protein subunit [Nitrosopumilaceae archaeon]